MTHHPRIAPYVQCRCPHCQFGPLRGVASGSYWPQGRSVAADEAQVRQCERDLESINDAATVAA